MRNPNTLLVSDAIQQLAPNAIFTLFNQDYSTLQWNSPDIVIPTLDQINSAIVNYVPPVSIQDQLANLQSQVAVLLAAKGN